MRTARVWLCCEIRVLDLKTRATFVVAPRDRRYSRSLSNGGGSHVEGPVGSRVVGGRRGCLCGHAAGHVPRRAVGDGRCARGDGLLADRRLLGLERMVALGEEGSRDEADGVDAAV